MLMWRGNLTVIEALYHRIENAWSVAATELQAYVKKSGDASLKCPICLGTFAQRLEKAKSERVSSGTLDVRIVRGSDFAISGIVINAIGFAALGTIFSLSVWWKVISKVTAPTTAGLVLLFVASAIQLAAYSLALQPLTVPVWALYSVLERLGYCIDLLVVLLLFWMWSGAAREMSLTEHSPLWPVIRGIATFIASVAFILDIVCAVLYSLAHVDANINGYWSMYGFIANGIARIFLAGGLLTFSLYVYHLATKSSWGEKLIRPFRRMLMALLLLCVSSGLFCGQQIACWAGNACAWPVRMVADALFLISMSFAFLSYFTQMRDRVQEETVDNAKQSLLQATDSSVSDEPVGLDLANYDY